MKTLDNILRYAQYSSCWYIRSLCLHHSNLDDKFPAVGVNEEGWLKEDYAGNLLYDKIGVWCSYLQEDKSIKISFEI